MSEQTERRVPDPDEIRMLRTQLEFQLCRSALAAKAAVDKLALLIKSGDPELLENGIGDNMLALLGDSVITLKVLQLAATGIRRGGRDGQ